MNNELKILQELVGRLNETNSANDKKVAFVKYPECKELLKWVYSPYTQFNVTSANLKKRKDLCDEIAYKSIIQLLTELNDRVITGHAAISAVNAFIEANKEYEELIYNIIDKNLKTRSDAKLINKVWINLIPQFDVALANKYDDRADKINFKEEKWFASRKLDGVRVITIIDEEGSVKFFSRQGKEFFTLNKIRREIENLGLSEIVFDGEVCIVDNDENENFTSIIKLIRKKDFEISNPKYKIFDCLMLNEFNEKFSGRILSDRISTLEEIFSGNKSKLIDVVLQWEIHSLKDFTQLSDMATKKKWEGLIIRKDVAYEGKRSNNMLKVKKFHDEEHQVLDTIMGPIRYIKDGKEIEELMLSAVVISYKGNFVNVGSGFTIEERKKYCAEPNLIIGKTITVKYFEESKNQDGKLSLRFPVIKHVYENGRDS